MEFFDRLTASVGQVQPEYTQALTFGQGQRSVGAGITRSATIGNRSPGYSEASRGGTSKDARLWSTSPMDMRLEPPKVVRKTGPIDSGFCRN